MGLARGQDLKGPQKQVCNTRSPAKKVPAESLGRQDQVPQKQRWVCEAGQTSTVESSEPGISPVGIWLKEITRNEGKKCLLHTKMIIIVFFYNEKLLEIT